MKRRVLPLVAAACVAAAGLSISVVYAQDGGVLEQAPLTLKKFGRRTGVWAKPTEGAGTSSVDQNVSIDLERGAITGLTHITVQRIVGHHDERIGTGTYEFGPRGQKFEKPVKICFTSSDFVDAAVKTGNACLGYFEPKTKEWVCEDTCLEKADDGRVCGTTDHFTSFAILLSGGGKDECRRNDAVNDDYAGGRAR